MCVCVYVFVNECVFACMCKCFYVYEQTLLCVYICLCGSANVFVCLCASGVMTYACKFYECVYDCVGLRLSFYFCLCVCVCVCGVSVCFVCCRECAMYFT